MISFLYIILAALGLGFLIFIHELAHYWMARRVGMRVEAFSIGFGKALFSWERQGVKWQIGWLPFGGYVRIAGMQKENGKEPHEIPDGYFSKRPIDRIKVAAIAPIVNIIVAFIFFTIIWGTGGRQKSFNEYTQRLGWIDPTSELFSMGIRPGDEIKTYNGHPYHSIKDLFQAAMLGDSSIALQGFKINYVQDLYTPFNVTIHPYQHPQVMESGILTTGVLSSAMYILYNPFKNGTGANPISNVSPMHDSGLAYGDRVIWVDGELIFSIEQLNHIINNQHTLLTIQRGSNTMLARIPRTHIADLKLAPQQHDEFNDWQYEAQIAGNTLDLFTIPFMFSSEGVIETPLQTTSDQGMSFFTASPRASTLARSLLPGDRIIAVDGKSVNNHSDILEHLQSHQVHVVVQTGNETLPLISWKLANAEFDRSIDWKDLEAITSTIGTANSQQSLERIKLLKPIQPKSILQLANSFQEGTPNPYLQRLEQQKQLIDSMSNVEEQAIAIKQFERAQNRLLLDIAFQDRLVNYNPPPYTLFIQVTKEVWSTLTSLFTGQLNPKWLAGPIGIVQVIHHGWSLGTKEALFWLAVISLNLGILNLLPIPVLDGGHICFALWEMITKKPLKAKTMERFIIPFVVLLIGFFIFVTYHDVLRLVKGIF